MESSDAIRFAGEGDIMFGFGMLGTDLAICLIIWLIRRAR
jgi:hypothetical protein